MRDRVLGWVWVGPLLGAACMGSYDPGSEGGVEDLWAWLVAATRAVPHANGEGHCEAAIIASN